MGDPRHRYVRWWCILAVIWGICYKWGQFMRQGREAKCQDSLRARRMMRLVAVVAWPPAAGVRVAPRHCLASFADDWGAIAEAREMRRGPRPRALFSPAGIRESIGWPAGLNAHSPVCGPATCPGWPAASALAAGGFMEGIDHRVHGPGMPRGLPTTQCGTGAERRATGWPVFLEKPRPHVPGVQVLLGVLWLWPWRHYSEQRPLERRSIGRCSRECHSGLKRKKDVSHDRAPYSLKPSCPAAT